jgi:hypothetical protein
MSSEVKAKPNYPPALEPLVFEALGEASVAWRQVEEDRIFDADHAVRIGEQLLEHIAKAFDDRETPLFVHLRNAKYHLSQVQGDPALDAPHFGAANNAVTRVLEMLEQHR